MLRVNTALVPFKFNICSNFAGLGDHLARLPAIKEMLRVYPHVSCNVYWHEYFVELAKLLLPETDRLKHFSIAKLDEADQTLPLVDFNYNRLSPLAMDLSDHAHVVLMDRLPEMKLALPLAPAIPLPHHLKVNGPYVVVTVAATSPTREWPVDQINEYCEKLLEHKVTPVFIGKTTPIEVGNGRQIRGVVRTELDVRAGVNFLDKTTLVEALGVMQRAKAVVGVDNGLLYLAGTTGVPRIRGMTTVNPKHREALGWGPLRNVVPERSLECRFCQSNVYFVKHDFRECLYGDYSCTSQMTAEKFFNATKEFL